MMRFFSLILTAGFTFAIPIANPPLNQRSVAGTSFESRSDVVQESKTLNLDEMQRANKLKRNDGLDDTVDTVDWVKRGSFEYLNKADRRFDGSTPGLSKKEVRSREKRNQTPASDAVKTLRGIEKRENGPLGENPNKKVKKSEEVVKLRRKYAREADDTVGPNREDDNESRANQTPAFDSVQDRSETRQRAEEQSDIEWAKRVWPPALSSSLDLPPHDGRRGIEISNTQIRHKRWIVPGYNALQTRSARNIDQEHDYVGNR